MIYHLTNIGPDAEWKIQKLREKFPQFEVVYRDYPMTQSEFDCERYDEGIAILNNLHSFGFLEKLSDQQIFEVFSFWHGIK